ncbi:MAG: type II toxin-antitoxin system prevent-host-death family antitoxin [Nitrospinae bacterium]|nr:type II toxin-antitoxin system prevent-host-death family antitoxin [Nitrospinota bacterium]
MKHAAGVSVGVKELKDRLTHYLAIAAQGGRVVVTERGKPVALMCPLTQTRGAAPLAERMARLARAGVITLPATKAGFARIRKVKIRGKPLSQTVLEDRR